VRGWEWTANVVGDQPSLVYLLHPLKVVVPLEELEDG